MKPLYFVCAVILVVAGSCTSAKENMQQPIPLYNTKWSLKKIYTDGKEEAVNTKAFIRFDKEKGSAGGNGSCNSFGSTATINDNSISFKNIFSTKMYCENVQLVENNFFGSLQNANRFEVRDKSLLLFHDNQLLLEFIAE